MAGLGGITAGLSAVNGGYNDFQSQELARTIRALQIQAQRQGLEDAARERTAQGAAFGSLAFTDPTQGNIGQPMLPNSMPLPGQPMPVGPGQASVPNRPPPSMFTQNAPNSGGAPDMSQPPAVSVQGQVTGMQPSGGSVMSEAPGSAPVSAQPPMGQQQPGMGGSPQQQNARNFIGQYDIRTLASQLKQQNPSMDQTTLYRALINSANLLNEQGKMELRMLLQKQQMLPAGIQEFEYVQNLGRQPNGKALQDLYFLTKRNNPSIDLGGSVITRSPSDPGGAPLVETPKTLKPGEQPIVQGEQVREKEGAALDIQREGGKTKAESALRSLEQNSGLVTSTIDRAIKAVNPWSAGYGSIFKWLPETQARALENDLNTIKANIGFDRLQEMRNNSPTGGALGAVSEMENRLLQAVNGALDQSQSKQLKQNLAIIKQLYPQVMAERRRAFNQDYGNVQARQPAGGSGNAPSLPKVGTVQDGYTFKGGDPSKQSSWEKVK